MHCALLRCAGKTLLAFFSIAAQRMCERPLVIGYSRVVLCYVFFFSVNYGLKKIVYVKSNSG